MSDLRWVRRGSQLVLQQRVRLERMVRVERHYISDPYRVEVSYEWQDVPVEEEDQS